MRTLRERMSEEMKEMKPQQQIEYIEKKSGFKRETHSQVPVESNAG